MLDTVTAEDNMTPALTKEQNKIEHTSDRIRTSTSHWNVSECAI